jgi:hypothetical protein
MVAWFRGCRQVRLGNRCLLRQEATARRKLSLMEAGIAKRGG